MFCGFCRQVRAEPTCLRRWRFILCGFRRQVGAEPTCLRRWRFILCGFRRQVGAEPTCLRRRRFILRGFRRQVCAELTCLQRWNRQSVPKRRHKIQTPGNYPEESIQHSEHGESFKSRRPVFPCELGIESSYVMSLHRV